MRTSIKRRIVVLAISALALGMGAAPASATVIGRPVTEWIGSCGLHYMNSPYPLDQFAATQVAGGSCGKMSVRAKFFIPANGGYAYSATIYNYDSAYVGTGIQPILTSWHACFVGTSSVTSRTVY